MFSYCYWFSNLQVISLHWIREERKEYSGDAVQAIAPTKIAPRQVRVRVWVRVRVTIRDTGQFSSGAIVLETLESNGSIRNKLKKTQFTTTSVNINL